MSVSTHVAYNFSDAQVKVREATSNDPWGPSTALMSEIADLTHNPMAFTEIMSIVWKRLNDSGKNWRHVYKSLVLLDFLIKCGHEKVAQQCRENVFTIETLKDFQHVEDNRDQGLNIREEAKRITSLLSDDERLKNERTRFILTRNKFKQNNPDPVGAESRRSNRHHVTDSTLDPNLEKARQSTATEEEMQLQIALTLSREKCEKAGEMREGDDTRHGMVLEESQKEADRLVTTIQGTVNSGQLSQSALDDLLSLGVGELVTGNSDQPSSPNVCKDMGTSGSVVLSGPLLSGNTFSSTPASTSVQQSSTHSTPYKAVFASNNDSLASLTPSQPASVSSYQFAAWGISAASAPAATLTTSNSFDLLGGDIALMVQSPVLNEKSDQSVPLYKAQTNRNGRRSSGVFVIPNHGAGFKKDSTRGNYDHVRSKFKRSLAMCTMDSIEESSLGDARAEFSFTADISMATEAINLEPNIYGKIFMECIDTSNMKFSSRLKPRYFIQTVGDAYLCCSCEHFVECSMGKNNVLNKVLTVQKAALHLATKECGARSSKTKTDSIFVFHSKTNGTLEVPENFIKRQGCFNSTKFHQLLDLVMSSDWTTFNAEYGKENAKYHRVKASTAIVVLKKMIEYERKSTELFGTARGDRKRLLETILRQLKLLENQ